MAKRLIRAFNPKKEVSVMAWIQDDQGCVLLVRQAIGQRLWTLPGGKVKRNESLKSALAREVREETGLIAAAVSYRQIYDRPKRGTITILYSVIVKRSSVRTRYPTREIADLGFFDELPVAATPSARFFWKSERETSGDGQLISDREAESAIPDGAKQSAELTSAPESAV